MVEAAALCGGGCNNSVAEAATPREQVGTVLEEEYATAGTRIVAYLPPSLRNKLQAGTCTRPAWHAPCMARCMCTACTLHTAPHVPLARTPRVHCMSTACPLHARAGGEAHCQGAEWLLSPARAITGGGSQQRRVEWRVERTPHASRRGCRVITRPPRPLCAKRTPLYLGSTA